MTERQGGDSAMDFLKRVEDRAKELYAMSNQGEWDALEQPYRAMWIDATARELRGEDD